MIKLNKPAQTPIITEKAFVSAANDKPGKRKSDMINFRASSHFHEIIAAEVERTGQDKTTILRAALLAYEELEPGERDRLLLESSKF
ncbi:CopG family transcriptional regulator [Enterobacter hormaechei]